MKKSKFILIVLISLFIINYKDVYAVEDNRDEYTIDKYNVNIKVHENNTLDITEEITANFKVPKHGIYRQIPLKNTIVRNDGTTTHNRTVISNISVDNSYTTSKSGGELEIKIGDSDKTLIGRHTYKIKYTNNLGKDPLKDIDELYYNIIGNYWDTTINDVSFSITMPKEIDKEKIGASVGSEGTIGGDIDVKYNEDNYTIYGNYINGLEPGEGITIRSELEEGYFVGASLPVNYIYYLMFIIPIIFAFISVFLWYKYGRDEEVVETIEFYPPEGVNSLELGFLYKGNADNEDAVSLLIYLANKGYIKISETESKALFSNIKGFKITKIKDYDGENVCEKLFLEGLFTKRNRLVFNKKDDNIDNTSEVTNVDLYNSFYITLNNILRITNTKENKNKIFEQVASSKRIFVLLMILLSYVFITIPPVFTFGEPILLIFDLIFPGIAFTILINVVIGKSYNNSIKTIITKIFVAFWVLIFGGIPWCSMMLPLLVQDYSYFIGYIVGVICIIIMVAAFKFLPKRTQYGREVLGKIKGFKTFLETARKDELELEVSKNPTYFYDILPFTYVLGVSSVWIEKFETIAMQAPSWYDSPNGFDTVAFSSFIDNTMNSAQSAMSSSPSSSDGGGGSSGGGSGGGGGGSW